MAGVVEQRPDAAPSTAGNDDVADFDRAALNEQRADRATTALELGFDDEAVGETVRVGLEIEQFGLEGDRLEQLVEVGALERRDRDLERLARHRLDDDLVLEQLGAHAVRIGLRLVDLVDGNDDRDTGSLGVIDGLDRLRHHAVVGRDHQHHDVRHLRAAGTHGGERGVARRVDEGDLLALLGRDLIGADVLGDTTGFTAGDIRMADGVEQRGLAVVDVAHDRDDGRTRLQILVRIVAASEAFLDVGFGNALGRVAEVLHDQLGRVGVDGVVDLVHRPLLHQEADHVDRLLRHAVGEFLDRDDLGDRHFAHDLVARDLDAGCAARITLALTAQRGERALTLLVVEELVDSELAALATIVGDLDGCARRALEVGAAPLLAIIVVRRFIGDRPALGDGGLGSRATGFRCGRTTGTRLRSRGRVYGCELLRRNGRCLRRTRGLGGRCCRRWCGGGCRLARCRLARRSSRGSFASTLGRALCFEALFVGAPLGVFFLADLLVDGGLLEGLAARIELTRGEIAEACTTCRSGTTAGACARFFFLAWASDRPALLALDHNHVLAAVAEALLDVPGCFGALQAQGLARAATGRGGLIRGFLGLTHACSDLALEPGSRSA